MTRRSAGRRLAAAAPIYRYGRRRPDVELNSDGRPTRRRRPRFPVHNAAAAVGDPARCHRRRRRIVCALYAGNFAVRPGAASARLCGPQPAINFNQRGSVHADAATPDKTVAPAVAVLGMG